jgi:hypothetical protein
LKQATLLALVLAVLAASGSGATIDPARAADRRVASRVTDAAVITRYRTDTWRWQKVMGKPLTVAHRLPAAVWRKIAQAVYRQALKPPHKKAWLCIHRYEASWQAHTGNGYYGGLQMDIEFQRFYAAWLLREKGTADHWTPLEQIWVAERAERDSGFYPWPNTARMCGLI